MSEGLAIIALGSNLGESIALIREAMDRLQEFSPEPLLRSSLWETAPVDCPPGSPPFVNAVVGLLPISSETPESLLTKLQRIEKEFGRKRKQVLNEPRTLDLDLIAVGNEVRATPQLLLPHPRAHQRGFVLQPLSEIAPDLILPGQQKAVSQLLQELPLQGRMEQVGAYYTRGNAGQIQRKGGPGRAGHKEQRRKAGRRRIRTAR